MVRLCCALIALCCLVVAAPGAQGSRSTPFRVLSWNVSGRAPVERPDLFRGHLRLAEPDIVVLDEVDGSLSEAALAELFADAAAADGDRWHLLWGARGGRQRIVIGARSPLAPIEAFQKNSYPDADAEAVVAAAPAESKEAVRQEMRAGIATNATVVTIAGRRLLIAGVDLQCCSAQWQEMRRLAEARHVRRLIERTIPAVRAQGTIVTGDFNLAQPPAGQGGIGVLPFIALSGPYPAPIHGLIAAEAVHRDRREAWTINGGPDSPFPFMPFDFQLYSPRVLRAAQALVMDTADYPTPELERVGLAPAASRELSDHLPVIVTYRWADGR
jgi:endonuclease/exonuclease/phosphatase family metal-dependent hydrolase